MKLLETLMDLVGGKWQKVKLQMQAELLKESGEELHKAIQRKASELEKMAKGNQTNPKNTTQKTQTQANSQMLNNYKAIREAIEKRKGGG